MAQIYLKYLPDGSSLRMMRLFRQPAPQKRIQMPTRIAGIARPIPAHPKERSISAVRRRRSIRWERLEAASVDLHLTLQGCQT